jgi:SAM-dependent methyltransferase
VGADLGTPSIRVTACGPLCARFESAAAPRAPDAEIAWYRERLPRGAGSVLEAMCGHGRLLVPLLEAGAQIHGVDVSSAMLAECAALLARASLTTPLFRQDITELNLPFRYGAAFIAGGSFQHLTDVDRARAALARIRAHLVDPGYLFLDLYVPAERTQRIAAPLVEVRSTSLADGSRIALRSETTMHPDARFARTELRYVHRRGHDLLGEEGELRVVVWYAPDDIANLVGEAGFREVEVGPPAHDAGEGTAFSISARALS